MNQERTIYKIVRAYYEDGLTQQEIANKFGISRMKVSRMLARALKDKIVQIRINSPSSKYPDLEHQIEAKYGLKEVVIADTKNDDQIELIASIGKTGE